MSKAKYIVIDSDSGRVFFRDVKGRTVHKFDYAFCSDLNEIRVMLDKFNAKVQKEKDEKSQGVLF